MFNLIIIIPGLPCEFGAWLPWAREGGGGEAAGGEEEGTHYDATEIGWGFIFFFFI